MHFSPAGRIHDSRYCVADNQLIFKIINSKLSGDIGHDAYNISKLMIMPKKLFACRLVLPTLRPSLSLQPLPLLGLGGFSNCKLHLIKHQHET